MRIAVIILLLAACGSPRRSSLSAPPRLASSEEVYGERLYAVFCHQCHPFGEGGLGPALNNKPLPAFAIRFQVRKGLGAMPSFSEMDITDDQLDAIVKYVLAIR